MRTLRYSSFFGDIGGLAEPLVDANRDKSDGPDKGVPVRAQR